MPGSCAGHFHSLSHLILIKSPLIDDVLGSRVSDWPWAIKYVLWLTPKVAAKVQRTHLRYNSVPLFVCFFDTGLVNRGMMQELCCSIYHFFISLILKWLRASFLTIKEKALAIYEDVNEKYEKSTQVRSFTASICLAV